MTTSALRHELEQALPGLAGVPGLADSHGALAEQVALLQALLATKVDRSEVGRLAARAAELEAAASWRANVDAVLSRLEGEGAEARSGVDRTLDTLGQLSAVITALAEATAGKAEVADFATLRGEVTAAARAVAERAVADANSAATRAVARASDAADAAARSAAAAAAAAASAARSVDAPCATAAAVEGRLAGAIAEVRAELEARAYVAALEATDEAVAAAAAAAAGATRKADVALRFVEWYAKHGEAFEANAATVDGHLKSLAASNAAAAAGAGASSLPAAR